jgi:hypothetical protein
MTSRKSKAALTENLSKERESIKAKIQNNQKERAASQDKNAQKAEFNKLILIPVTLVVGVCLSWLYNNWLAGRINTPLNEPKIVDELSYTSPENLDRYWGTYRSNLYFGLKTRSQNPFQVGMMWFNQFNPNFQMRCLFISFHLILILSIVHSLILVLF